MSRKYALSATLREGTGKGVARALRRNDQIPAVIYGDKKAPVTIAMSAKDANLEYNKGHMFSSLCELELDGAKHMVLARDIQLHPVTDNVLHVDFLRITKKTSVNVNVSVNFINHDQSPGLNEKGTLNIVRYEIELVCLATNIPNEIEVDLTGKENGDVIHMSDITLPEGSVPAISDRDFTIATLVAPKRAADLEAEDAAEGEEGAEAAEGEGDAAGEEAPAEE